MAIQHVTNEYQIPRGRVYFDRFDTLGNKTGEVAFGNCPGFSFTAETEKAEHFSSEGGLAEKDASLVIRVNRTGSLTCDNFSVNNLALFISGDASTLTQAATPVVDEAYTVKQGRIYQLGESAAMPAGARDVSAVTVENAAGTTTYILDTDYVLDLALGRIQIVSGGGIADDSVIHVSYTPAAKTWSHVKSGSVAEVTGALRVVADNAAGTNRDWYFPKVTLTPGGELPVIQEGTDFTSMEFGIEVLKSANREAMYIDGRPAA